MAPLPVEWLGQRWHFGSGGGNVRTLSITHHLSVAAENPHDKCRTTDFIPTVVLLVLKSVAMPTDLLL